MKTTAFIFRLIVIALLILFQQGLIFVIGFLVFTQGSTIGAIVVWLLAIPMLYLNYKTYRLIMKYGIINFITVNADTSEIDVPKGDRWYDGGKA